MKFIIGVILIAGAGIYLGLWNANQVTTAGTQAVKVGSQVAGAVGNALTDSAAKHKNDK
jgi:hypothetical protein